MKKQLSDLWCSLMHESPMWPMHGRYQCRTCLREYPVRWEGEPRPEVERRPVAWAAVPSPRKEAGCTTC